MKQHVLGPSHPTPQQPNKSSSWHFLNELTQYQIKFVSKCLSLLSPSCTVVREEVTRDLHLLVCSHSGGLSPGPGPAFEACLHSLLPVSFDFPLFPFPWCFHCPYILGSEVDGMSQVLFQKSSEPCLTRPCQWLLLPLLFCVPTYISGVFVCEIFVYVTVLFQSNDRGSHILSLWMVHAGCVLMNVKIFWVHAMECM